jgi:hypothetical protein
VRDLFRFEPAHFAEGERDARVGRERWMAAGEDEPQTVILDARAFVVDVRRHRGFDRSRDLVDGGVEPGASPQPVDRFEPAGRDEPRARIGRNSVTRP